MAMGGARVLRRLVRVRDRVVVVERAERRLGVHEVDVVQLEEAPVPVAGARALLEEVWRCEWDGWVHQIYATDTFFM